MSSNPLLISAVSCLPLSLPTPLYASTNCSSKDNSTGYYCEVRCDQGYYFYEKYENEVFVTECYTGGDWNNKHIPSCVCKFEYIWKYPIVPCFFHSQF